MNERIDRNLGMELVRVTEAAALSAARYMGTGDKNGGDGAAVDAMRAVLRTVQMDGTVVIGEGEKDEAPMLYNGEIIGSGQGPQLDVAVDPVEGTSLLALGRPNAIAVIAATRRGAMLMPGASLYMEKIVVGRAARDAIDLTLPAGENLHNIARALGRKVHDLTVFILDKPRHKTLIAEVRATGARISLQTDGDVLGALMAAMPETGVDVLMGIGGTPEGVIAATAVKALGGGMQARFAPQLAQEQAQLVAADPHCLTKILQLGDLVCSDDAFFAATGITDGLFLKGVRFDEQQGVTTHSIVIRGLSGSIRFVDGIHQLNLDHLYAPPVPSHE